MTDGMISVEAFGGTSPYEFDWSNGETAEVLSNLSSGVYELTVTDLNACDLSKTIELKAPEQLDMQVDYQDPNCEGLETGEISLSSIAGGVPPYLFALNQNEFSSDTAFMDLPEGNYELVVKDANDCVASSTGILTESEIPEIQGQEIYDIKLGDSVAFQISVNDIALSDIQWHPSETLSCTDCIDPIARPLSTTNYSLVVVSEDDCEDVFEVTVNIEKTRAFYTANIFSPNSDGVNDYFNLIGSQEVAQFNLLIFDRWGSVIFDEKQIPSSDETLGWNGRSSDGFVNPGVYVWLAEVTFIDGESFSYTGNVTVVR